MKRSLLNEKNINMLTLSNLKKKYRSLFKNIFEIEGLNDSAKNYLLEKLLDTGQIAAFNLNTPKSVDYKELAFGSFVEKGWRWDKSPKLIKPLNEFVDAYYPNKLLIVGEEAVVLKFDFIPRDFIIEYSQRIYDIQKTIDTNLTVHKMPFIIHSTDKKTIAAIKKILLNERIVAVDDLMFDVIETKAPYIIDKLQEYKSEVEAELLTILGIDNMKYEKKAQMTSLEIDKNLEEVNSYKELFKVKLELFFKDINEILGHNIRIKEDEFENKEDQEDDGSY